MVKRLTQVLGATWLFWLYANTPIFSAFKAASSQTVQTFGQPVGAGVNLITRSTRSLYSVITAAVDFEATTGRARLEIGLSQRQVVLYRGNVKVKSYPIAIGRAGWETPTGQFKVLHMRGKPIWIHPLTKEVIPNDNPKNPLGRYWVAFWTDGTNWIGFHGTPETKSVGQSASHGCIRMYDADIDELYYQISTGTPVTVKP